MSRALKDLSQGFCFEGIVHSGSIGLQSLLEYPTQLTARAEGSGMPDEGEELKPGPEDPGVHFLWNLGAKDTLFLSVCVFVCVSTG